MKSQNNTTHIRTGTATVTQYGDGEPFQKRHIPLP